MSETVWKFHFCVFDTQDQFTKSNQRFRENGRRIMNVMFLFSCGSFLFSLPILSILLRSNFPSIICKRYIFFVQNRYIFFALPLFFVFLSPYLSFPFRLVFSFFFSFLFSKHKIAALLYFLNFSLLTHIPIFFPSHFLSLFFPSFSFRKYQRLKENCNLSRKTRSRCRGVSFSPFLSLLAFFSLFFPSESRKK